MNKYLIFASDERSYSDLKNIVLELKKRDLPYFFLYSNSNNRLFPFQNLEEFSYDTNIEYKSQTFPSKTLGFELPFKPDVLLITNENWEPEKSILWEFKQWGCFIGCVENSSWTHNNIKCKLEIASRKSFPTNCIDVFFDHSQWGLESKKQCGWWSQKSIITGNPKFDNFNFLKSKEERNIIVYGSMEIEHHQRIISIYHNISNSLKEWKVYYKPHPSELKDFPNDFNDIKVINNYKSFLEMCPKSSYHVGIFSSVMYYPLIMGKNIVNISQEEVGIDDELNIKNFEGHEFNFWKGILGFKEFKEFEDFIGKDFIQNQIKRNKKLQSNINLNLVTYKKDCTFIYNKSNNKEVINYFDSFNDNKSSQRIINYIENE